jgi:hypothetical protein
MKRLLALLVIGIGMSFVLTNSASAITYGSEDTQAPTNSPWVVLILHYPSDESQPDYFCTGTLIKPNTVLTAGHCVDPSGRFEVKYGITTFSEEGRSYPVSGAWRSPRFSAARYGVNDIGLLKLKESIPGAQTVPLNSKASVLKAESSKDFKLFGWGVDQNGENATYLRLTTVSNQTASLKRILGKSFNSNTWLAAGRLIPKEKIYSGGCSGDSGGPLMARVNGKYVQVGITSFGAQDCDTSNPTIFMRLSYYLKDLSTGIRQLSTNAVLVDRSLPEIVTQPIISGNAEVGQTISCSPGKWSANAKTIGIDWSISGEEEISNGPSLQVSKELAGLELQCTVKATSAAGSVSVSTKITIDRSLPNPLSQPSIAGSARVLTTLTCNSGTWNKFTTSLQIAWAVEGSSRSLANGNSFTVPEEAAGKTVNCEVTGSGLAGTFTTKTSIQIPAKPQISGSLTIFGLPTSGYAAGNGVSVQCTGASSSGVVESTETVWYLRDSAVGSPVTKVATGNSFALPQGFFDQNKGRVLICGYSASGPGGFATIFDVQSIVAPRIPEAPSVQVIGFPNSGTNADAWLNLTVTCKVDSFIDNSVARSTSVQWRIYDSSAPYYPLASTPSTPIGTGSTLTLSKAILDQAALKSIGCAGTVSTATGSATGFSTKTYVDYRNIALADANAPTFTFLGAVPYNPPFRFNDPLVMTLNVSDVSGISKDSAFSFRAIGPNSNEVTVSRVELPYLLSGDQFSGKYEYKIMLSPGSPVVLGSYRILININDTKYNSTGWQTLTTFEMMGVRTN